MVHALILLTALLAVPAIAGGGNGIHVTGNGEVKVVPDMAYVTLEVRREGEDAAALKEDLDRVTGAILELTDGMDIPRREVTAASVNIYPHYRRRDDEQVVDGLIAVRTVEVTLRDLGDMGKLINAALERGANGVGGVNLDAQNRVELERQALNRAIDDATREAQQVAERFEVRLGALKDATTGAHQVQPMMMETAGMRSAARDSFSPGEMTIRREVRATFGIGGG